MKANFTPCQKSIIEKLRTTNGMEISMLNLTEGNICVTFEMFEYIITANGEILFCDPIKTTI
jgi:hypothetical protein